jgi:signal transduction histidine kinase
VSVIAHIDSAELLVRANETQLGRLLLILVGNAVKYTPRGGVVNINARRELCFITISIADTGVGIAAEDLPHIFERFWRCGQSQIKETSAALASGCRLRSGSPNRMARSLTCGSEPGRGS